MTRVYASASALLGSCAHRKSSSVQKHAIVSATSRIRVVPESTAIVTLVIVSVTMSPTAQVAASGTTPAAAASSHVHENVVEQARSGVVANAAVSHLHLPAHKFNVSKE